MDSDPFPLPVCIIEKYNHKRERVLSGDDLYVLVADRGETVVYVGFNLVEEGQYVQWSEDHDDFMFDAAVTPDTEIDYPPVSNLYEWNRVDVFAALMAVEGETATFTPYAIRRACQNWAEADEQTEWESLQAIRYAETDDGFSVDGVFRPGIRRTDEYEDIVSFAGL